MRARTPSWTPLATKLRPPTQRQALLARERLAPRIEQALTRRLLVIAAPAGYGKTSTLCQIHARLAARGARVAWLSLDAADADPARMLAHLLAALARVCLDLRGQFGGLLADGGMAAHHGPDSAPLPAALHVELVQALASQDQSIHLVLDDFHLLHGSASAELVSALLNAPLAHLHLVIATRERPALPLARLRAQDEVHEFDAADLAFSHDEAAQFAAALTGRALSAAQVEQLRERTEGWAASLQMALIALQNSHDPDGFLRHFSGADRSIADFLLEEVLRGQPPEVQTFLLVTSILQRFNCALADAVLERNDARQLLDVVEARNLFVFSLDRERQWYRYHPLFAELLRRRLAEQHAAQAPAYHRRACDWLAAQGHTGDAIEHAFAQGDLPRAGALLDAASPALFASGQTATLQAHAARLPPQVLRRLPRLQLELIWEDVICWRFEAARESLAQVQAQLSDAPGASASALPAAELAALRMKHAHRQFMLDVFTDRLDAVLAGGARWRAEYGEADPFMSGSVGVALMMSRRERHDLDLCHAEWAAFATQMREAGAVYGTVFLDMVAGDTLLARGELALAGEALQRAQATAVRLRGAHSALAAMPGARLAALYYERNELDAARRLLDADADAPFGLLDGVIARHVVRAALARVRGDAAEAHRQLDAATHLADRHRLTRLHAHVLVERITLLHQQQQWREAAALARDARYRDGLARPLPGDGSGTTGELYALARARLACARPDAQARVLLRRWFVHAQSHHARASSVRLGAQLARLHRRAGEPLAARRALIEALRGGEGFTRSVLDAGPEVIELLAELVALEPGQAVCARARLHELLAAAGHGAAPAAEAASIETADLTPRELDIVRLTAGAHVSHEIAAQLGLSESTVKWYWRRIFEKLGVRRRTVAVRVARQRGWLNS